MPVEALTHLGCQLVEHRHPMDVGPLLAPCPGLICDPIADKSSRLSTPSTMPGLQLEVKYECAGFGLALFQERSHV